MPHHFSDQSRISRLRHSHRAERVPGTIELERIGNLKCTSKLPEPVLKIAQSDVSGRSLLRWKDPSFSWL